MIGSTSHPGPAHRVAAAQARERALLGVCEGASRGEVTAAFRRQAREVHPDRHQHRGPEAVEQAQAEFVALTAAYERLLSAAPVHPATAVVVDGVYRPTRAAYGRRQARTGLMVSAVL